jgi:epoxyqueuosine reductase
MTPPEKTAIVRNLAREAGFQEVGVAVLESLDEAEEGRRYREWLAAGRHGSMGYLAREPERRLDPRRVLPGARSVICVALNYWEPAEERAAPANLPPGAGGGRVARYARGRDYHKVFTARLKRLEALLAERFPEVGTRRYVDTGPVLEKLWAERAGLGWRGKHTNLVSRRRGSWLLLGEVLTDLDLAADPSETDHCGSCTRCLEACPTGAITGPYRLDARLCISYLTIEHRGSIPPELRPLLGDRVFGCDDCLEVCPWNRFAEASRVADFRPRPGSTAPLLAELAAMDEAAFRERFAGTPIMRARREGLARNACVALGNVGGPGAEEALTRALADPSPLVREHAVWGLERLRARQGETSGGPGSGHSPQT